MLDIAVLIIIPAIAAASCLLLPNLRAQYTVSVFVSAAHLLFSVLLFAGVFSPGMPDFFSRDALSTLFILVLSNVYFWVVLVSYAHLTKTASSPEGGGKKYYFSLLNFYVCFNSAAILSNHFGLYWVAAEATTLSVAPLIYYYRNEEALEAMWKYLFVVSVGIAFAFIGIVFLSLSAAGTPMEGRQLMFTDFIQNAGVLDPVWLKASFVFIFVGLGTKIGLAPTHLGDVDATSNAPGPIAALMSGSLRITALLGVMRILQIVSGTAAGDFARGVMIVGGLLSVFAAFLFVFRAGNYKRLLAYSSVEHLGIIVLALGIGKLAVVGALYHVIYNSLTKCVLFLSAGNIHRRYGSREIRDVRSVLRVLPWSGWLLLLGFLAISGIPPFGIFFSELMIFQAALFHDWIWILPLLLFMLLFIFIYMGKALFSMLYADESGIDSSEERERFGIMQFAPLAVLVILLALAVSAPSMLHDHILRIADTYGVTL
ncbi:MAG: proton-conducting transporter membrane subunit [Bacteroidota bacterium]